MLRAFLRTPSAAIGMVVIALLVIVTLAAGHIWGTQANVLHVFDANQHPSWHHVFGTDQLGRDILLRLLVATRLSLLLALAAAALGAAIGIPFGIGAAALPQRARNLAMRAIDTMLAFPAILVAIFIGAVVGPGAFGATLGVGIALSFSFARVASTLAMSVGGRDYVAAARVIGVRPVQLMRRYIFPNIAEVLAVTTTVSISTSIVQISSLSFLGLGVHAPQYDWGGMLTQGVQTFYLNPAAAIAPAGAIAVSALAFGFTGEAVARAMNPVLWSRRSADGAYHDEAPNLAELPNGDANHSLTDDDAPVPASEDSALRVRNLTIEFPSNGQPIRIVDGVTFSLAKGEMLGIVGESGSGKTMTAMAIAQLIPYPGTIEGQIELEGVDLRQIPAKKLSEALGSKLAIVFQDPASSLNPALKIGTQLAESVEVHEGQRHRDALQLAEERLREVNIPTPARQLKRHPHELSGGMRQRVMIAMGLMKEPTLLIGDEPTTALDVTIQAQIMSILDRVNRNHNTAVILISHNLVLVSQYCHRILVMYAGRIMEDLTTAQLHRRPLHPYTRDLLAAVPDLSRSRDVPLATIPGQAPGSANALRGCAYHPRCSLAIDKCRVQRPALQLHSDGQRVACWRAGEAT